MKRSFRAFMERTIDYAGLFPPAELELEAAIHNYARYRSEPEGWILARFVCPAGQLDDLEGHADLISRIEEPCGISVVLTGAEKPEDFLKALDEDLEAIGRFRRRHGERTAVDILESRVPTRLLKGTDAKEIGVFLEDAAHRIREAGLGNPRFFLESAPPSTVWGGDTQSIIEGLSLVEALPCGYKIRCGGLFPSAFPPSDQIARAIVFCRDSGVALKATAGLHHPVSHDDESLHVRVHGFLNLIGAALLAHEFGLDEDPVRAILDDTDPADFVFSENGFAWRDLRVGAERIRELRPRALASFGSCSFDEPRDDLRRLGLLGS